MDLSDAVLSDLPNPSLRACRANLIIVLTRSHCSDRELSLSVGISLSCNVRCPAEWRRHSRGSCLDAFLVVRGAGCHNTWAQIIINIMWLPLRMSPWDTKYSNYFCGCWFDLARLVKIKEWVDGHDAGALVIPFSGGLESSLQDMSEEETQKYCTEHKTQRLISIQSPHNLLSAVSSVHSFNCMCW